MYIIVLLGCCSIGLIVIFFFRQKTAYEMRISDWSSDVCSSDLTAPGVSATEIRIELSPDLSGTRGCGEIPDQTVPEESDTNRTYRVLKDFFNQKRAEERRVGKECVSTGRSRGSTWH